MVASTWITPGCVQFLKNKKRFHTAWTHLGHFASLKRSAERIDTATAISAAVAAPSIETGLLYQVPLKIPTGQYHVSRRALS
jgi:hypothetical protein